MNNSTQLQQAPAFRRLKQLSATALGAMALMSAAPAMADTINFESQLPDIFAGGSSFIDHGFNLLVIDSPFSSTGDGLAGVLVNGADPYTCFTAVCPSGNTSTYYAGLNDGAVKLTGSDARGFRLSGIDYAFVSPIGGLSAGLLPGKLTIAAEKVGGGTVYAELDFSGLNSNSASPFLHAALTSQFGTAAYSSVVFSSCLFDGAGGCSPYGNQAQFAIDNIEVTAVPEPQTYAMLGLGLAAIGLLSRRRRASHNA